MFTVSEFTVDCTVLHFSTSTLDCECFNYGLHCLVGTYVRLQPLDSKCQARGGPIEAAHTLHVGCLPEGWAHPCAPMALGMHTCDWAQPKAHVVLGSPAWGLDTP